jgi:glycosyltransferase involved in cell wall biosynthesis
VNWQDRDNPEAGGAEIHLHETFGRLARAGHQVTLLCSGFEGGAAGVVLDGIDVHRVGGRYSFALLAHRYWRRHLAHQHFDVIVEDLNKIPLFTPAWSEAPVLLLVHHLFGATAFGQAPLPIAALTWLLERTLPRAYARRPVVAVSPSTRDDLVARGFSAEAITIIPNGVDTDHFTPAPAGEPARFDEPTLLYIGRLRRYKGVEFVLRALARLRARGDSVRLIVAGQGDDRPRLEQLAATLGIDDAVEFVGFVSEERKLELLRRAWIHVLTSANEGWGITVLEAAACGTPTVASDAPGLRDSVRHDETGRLVPHGDVAALEAALHDLLHDNAGREAMAEACVRHAAHHSWDAGAQQLAAVAGATLDSHPSTP